VHPIDRHPVTLQVLSMQLPSELALSHVERQRRYRASRDLLSIDIQRKTAEAISALRFRTGMTANAIIAVAVAAFAAQLDKTLPGRPRAKLGRQSQDGSRSRTPGGQPSSASSHRNSSQGESPVNQTPRGMGSGNSAKTITGGRRSNQADNRPVAQPDSSLSGNGSDTLPSQGILDLFGEEKS
jgi:hypothetical protein